MKKEVKKEETNEYKEDKIKDNLFKYFFQLYKNHFNTKKARKPFVETSRESRQTSLNPKEIRMERSNSFSLDTKRKSTEINLIETFIGYLKDKVPNQVLDDFQEHFNKEIKSLSKEHLKNIVRSPNINTIKSMKKSINPSRNLDKLFKLSCSKQNIKEMNIIKEEVKKKEEILSNSSSPNEKKQFFKRIHKGLKYDLGLNKTNYKNNENACKINISMNLPQKKNAISNYSSLNDTIPGRIDKSKKVIIRNTPKNYVFNHNLRGYLNKNKVIDDQVKKVQDKKQEINKESLNKKLYNVKESFPQKRNKISPCNKQILSSNKEKDIIKKYIHQNKFIPNNQQKKVNSGFTITLDEKALSLKKNDKNINNNISNEPTYINSSQRNEVSNHQSLDFMKDIKMSLEDNLKNLLNFSYENFMTKDKDDSDSISAKSFEKSPLNFSHSESLNKESIIEESIDKIKNTIQYTGMINLDKFDDNIRKIVFRKINI